ncbi:MAG: L-2-hydroxyglutarate oxidase [Bacteroidales bacterium]|nr:L-2-hydroxyglutarate oxidase [Bacteroidales bacterium]
MINNFDVIIIGAGIVGLATAYQIKKKNKSIKIAIIEKENDVAQHQSGRNSGVIHSGIYYIPGSLKAKNCIRGYELLLNFLNENNIKYKICGKLIVATNEVELNYLLELYERGQKNGLNKIQLIDATEFKNYEPYVNGIKAIYVPYTGVTDFYQVASKLKELLLKDGVKIFFNEKVINFRELNDNVEIISKKTKFNCKHAIFCAGLYSDIFAKKSFKDLNYRIIPFKGQYYHLTESASKYVNSLIYPVPDKNFPFLGIHFSRHINNDVSVGPNALFTFKRESYLKFNFSIKDTFLSLTWPGFYKVVFKYFRTGLREYYLSLNKSAYIKNARKLLPSINKNDLIKYNKPGVRAQACTKDGKLIDDFLILNTKNIIHVCNAPSPAATSALSIGEYVVKMFLQE